MFQRVVEIIFTDGIQKRVKEIASNVGTPQCRMKRVLKQRHASLYEMLPSLRGDDGWKGQ
nr:MAG TPA: hypothetical protein [Caudoviricetes sp.]